jgi:hypothetical protein
MLNKLEKLLLDTPETYYWMGFIMADGHFTKNRLTLGLSIKDENLLKALSTYLGFGSLIKTNKGSISFSVMDTKNVPLIRDKFNINNRKTYNPPNTIKWMSDDLLYSFIIGFIDGDGSIKKQTNREDVILRIKVHSNWFNIISEMSEFLSNKSETKTVKPKIDKEGYCNINLANHQLLKHIKSKAIELKLPYLSRKWSLVDETKINKMERATNLLSNVKRLMTLNYSNKMITEELGVSYSSLSNIQKRNGLR